MGELSQKYLNECFLLVGRDIVWNDRPRSHFKTSSGYEKYKSSYKGNIAGSIQRPTGKKNQYRIISINGQFIFAHRAAYIMHCGEIPDGMYVDHIDGNGLNNALSNLRVVSNKENSRNMRRYENNTSGCTGVSFDKARGRWAAAIFVDKKHIYLGRHKTIFEAACARKSAEVKFNFHENHGR